jgi:toxin ParE1/3/4
MNHGFDVSPSARRDLDDVWSYVAPHNSDAADRLIDDLHECFAMLARHPGFGSRCDRIASGLRRFPEGRYVVYYRPLDADDYSIEIVRVLHGSRDVGKAFGLKPGDGE